MNAFHVVDALCASFFALLGVWAAVDRRHWFLRFAVVAGFLLTALLIPAYQLVIEFGIAVGLIMTGVCLARGPWKLQPRLSLETALLLMVVVAVGAAVGARVPEFGVVKWVEIVGIGITMAGAGLACLWVVYGRAHWWLRFVAGLSSFLLGFALLHLCIVVQTVIGQMGNAQLSWHEELAARYEPHEVVYWLQRLAPSVAGTLGIMFAVLFMARASGWFTSTESAREKVKGRFAFAARAGLVTMLLAVVAPLMYLVFRLATPPTIPVVVLPTPNGYDDFVAAGKLVPPAAVASLRTLSTLSRTQMKTLYDQLADVDELIAQGLTRECRVRHPYYPVTDLDMADLYAVLNASYAMTIRLNYLRRFGDANELVAACLREMRFAHESNRGSGLDALNEVYANGASRTLQDRLGELDAMACRDLARQLFEIDRSSEPRELKRAVESVIDQNSDWETHVQFLLTPWSGDDPYPLDWSQSWSLAHTRLAIVDVALQAYWLEHQRAPNSLDELVPVYLPEVPLDPCGPGPVRYVRRERGYIVYSVGGDGDDDGGVLDDGSYKNGDYATEGPHSAPLSHQLKRKLDAGRARLLKLLLPHRHEDP